MGEVGLRLEGHFVGTLQAAEEARLVDYQHGGSVGGLAGGNDGNGVERRQQ